MKLHVATPVHNAVESYRQCAKSLKLALDGFDFTYTVYDDHSSSNLSPAIKSIAESVGGTYIHTDDVFDTPNPNLSKILNHALDSMPKDADYFLFVESDVFLQEDCIHKLVKAHGGNPKWGAVTPTFLGENELVLHTIPGCPHYGRSLDFVPKGARVPMAWSHLGCILVRPDVARHPDVRADEQFNLWWVDHDYALSIRQTGNEVVWVSEAVAVHRGSQSSSQPGTWNDKQAETRKVLTEKWTKLGLPV